MSIIQQVPWRVQPQGPVEVKTGLNISGVFLGSQSAFSLVNKESTVKSASGVTTTATSNGLAQTFSASGNSKIQIAADADSLIGLTEGTVAVFHRWTDTTLRASSSIFGFGPVVTDFLQAAPYFDGNLYWDFGDTGTGRLSVAYTKDTQWETLVFVAGGGKGQEIWRRGAKIASNANTPSRPATSLAFNVGGKNASNDGDNQELVLLVTSKKAWSDAQIRDWCRNPYGETFAPQTRRIWAPAGSGGASGTVAATNANDTSAASGTTTVTGTLAKSNGSDTSAASGTTTIVGTSAATNADDTSAASGSVGSDATGTAAITNANDTAAASGTTTVTGTVARTNTDDSVAASGWAGSITGTLNLSNGSDTSSASGVVTGSQIQGGGGWLPQQRRRTRKELHAERVRLGILPAEVVKAAKKAAAVVLDEPSPVKAYRADPEAANRVFLRELGATKMLPDWTRAIQLQIQIQQQEDEELLLFF